MLKQKCIKLLIKMELKLAFSLPQRQRPLMVPLMIMGLRIPDVRQREVRAPQPTPIKRAFRSLTLDRTTIPLSLIFRLDLARIKSRETYTTRICKLLQHKQTLVVLSRVQESARLPRMLGRPSSSTKGVVTSMEPLL